MFRLFSLFLVFSLASSVQAIELKLEGLDNYIQAQMTRSSIPGVAVAVTQGNEIVFAKGYGVKRFGSSSPVDEETLFHIGSTNKSISAFLTATLVDQGMFHWNSTVGEVLPSISFQDSAIFNIPLFRLPSMTAGFVAEDEDYFFDGYGDYARPQDLISFISSLRLAVLPGKGFEYSNMSAAFAGYINVLASGASVTDLNQGYADLLQEQVFDPIGMDQSTVFVSEARASDNFSYSHTKQDGTVVVAETEDRDGDPLAPAGSVKSNAVDMAAYLITVANRGVGPEGNQVLSWGALRRTWRAARISGKDKYALGWDVKRIRKRRVLIHEGAFDNFVSVIMIDKRARVGLVVLANTEYVGRLLRRAPRKLLGAIRRTSKR